MYKMRASLVTEILICTLIKYMSQLKSSVRSRTGFRTQKYRNFLYWTSLLKKSSCYFWTRKSTKFFKSLEKFRESENCFSQISTCFPHPKITLGFSRYCAGAEPVPPPCCSNAWHSADRQHWHYFRVRTKTVPRRF